MAITPRKRADEEDDSQDNQPQGHESPEDRARMAAGQPPVDNTASENSADYNQSYNQDDAPQPTIAARSTPPPSASLPDDTPLVLNSLTGQDNKELAKSLLDKAAAADADRLAADSGSTPADPSQETDQSSGPVDYPQMIPDSKSLYEQKLARRDELRDSPIARDHRWKSALVAGLLGLGQTFGQHPSRNWGEFAQNAVGAAAYPVAGAINPTMGNRMIRDIRLANAEKDLSSAQDEYGNDLRFRQNEAGIQNAELKPFFQQQQIQLRQQAIENRALRDQRNFDQKIQAAKDKAVADGNKYDIYIDEKTGGVFKRFKNDPTKAPEPFTDENGQQFQAPSHKVYDYVSPSGTAVQVKGSDLLRTDVGLAQAAASTANSADRYNASQQDEYQQKLTAYHNQQADLTARSIAALNIAGDSQKDLDDLAATIQQQGYSATPQQQTELASLRSKIRDKQAESQQYKTQYMSLQEPPRPTTIAPRIVKPGKPVPKSKDPLGLYQ